MLQYIWRPVCEQLGVYLSTRSWAIEKRGAYGEEPLRSGVIKQADRNIRGLFEALGLIFDQLDDEGKRIAVAQLEHTFTIHRYRGKHPFSTPDNGKG